MARSLNVPVPNAVARRTAELEPLLTPFDRVRDRHTLLVKRLSGPRQQRGVDGLADLARLRERLRPVLAGTAAFEVRVTHIDYFERPPKGSAPVVYLAVESPGLRSIHRRLVAEFGAVDGLEGDDYDPHVTLARGGSVADAERLATRPIDPITWTVSELEISSRDQDGATARVSLTG